MNVSCEPPYRILNGWIGGIEPVPKEFSACSRWQYSTGDHSSPTRDMLVSIILTSTAPDECIVELHHLVLEESLQWITRGNVTSHGNTNLLGVPQLDLLAQTVIILLVIYRANCNLYLGFELFAHHTRAPASAFAASSPARMP